MNDAGGEPIKTGDKVVVPGVIKGELPNGDLIIETKYAHPSNQHHHQLVVNAVQTKLEK